ncbi:microcin C7 resistance protein MccF [Candidatus Uhrbacteria bacterium RIFCSPLOWO2_01_FULL_47_24]|uniref:Microcin C7 resistance protein MccF n=1 Tax=Candidatus Uhrbacteria bacterium RIFCSPLOWO2_01_FULL_47_24 TaxID=1802401 RepID=A0A1F7UNZ5_9BACT|nr:MAG: microcin C7 resistance protein MccF [Candidatus Uhrbacteria bacterium RIFCSPHIGHO2_01_FULL_47_11]OGL67530.1 MAG: microcin C7 resistance protein MccF [Candidatus Uhrbacteria bacterium RIFCSPHIGHO2_02_FULL_46_47]OGL76675.1 MAG: microcin C7 resistance protein MccF [Candidatus Uhrbacteria bacterium RIFCSPHIGHO2_12_FULL_47_11]OGL79996.1 MAG: microcin C7 resistance protein MccF [Candidatus Uhrbacteria bacterium RIFCSPLOWO2_01_FULL_47_24]OGL84377.1 MAG: microcin C7 resistance protein MccF [Can
MIKPKRLKQGDVVAIISPSWGGPSAFPHIYENGLKILREWGLKIKEFPATRADAEFLRQNPKVRAKEINDAFADPKIKAIFTSIGGNDSVRILPFVNKNIIVNNPKILMGYSDTSTLHVFLNLQGLVSFYGPSIMAGFSQMNSLPKSFKSHVREILFEPKESYEYKPYKKYCDGYPDWANKENLGKVNPMKPNDGWHWLQGRGRAQGELFGGCIEVLEMMKATDFWPSQDFWKGKILFLETSENKPSLHFIDHVLRNYGMLGIFDQISGLIFSRARDYSDNEKKKLEEKIVSIITKEFSKPDLPIVTNFDVGHTDPQLVLPLGVKTEIDCLMEKITLIESWLI